MSHRPGVMRYVLAACVLLLIAAAIAGCSSASTTTTSGSEASSLTTTTSGATNSSTTTALPLSLSKYDKELAKTATVQHGLSLHLREQQAADDDPRFAIVYGLRARAQAITGRQALEKKDLKLADTAMRDVYSTLNLGRRIATGTTARTLADAYAVVQKLGIPSDAPDRAAGQLDEFIAKLSGLLEEATAIAPNTSST